MGGDPKGRRWASQAAQEERFLVPMQETQETSVRCLSQKDPLKKEMATRSSILAWKTPWTEEPGGLKSTSHEESGMTEHARACICTHDSLIHFTVQQNLILHCDAITPLPQRETASKAMFPKVSGSENLS